MHGLRRCEPFPPVGHLYAVGICAGPSGRTAAAAGAAGPSADGDASRPESRSNLAKLIDNIPAAVAKKLGDAPGAGQLTLYQPPGGPAAPGADAEAHQRAVMAVIADKGGNSSAAVSRRIASKWPRPVWHAPWKMYRVISGHLG